MQSKTSPFINLAAVAVVGLAWFAGQIAWYIALPLMVAFLWRSLPSSPKAVGSASGCELPATFKFTYIDRDGVSSKRTVDVNGISHKDAETYLEGFCHRRGEGRTFRTDRILGQLTNLGTGEVIDVEDLLLSVRERAAMTFKPVVKSGSPNWQTAVLFTGFAAAHQEELEELATAAGWDVRATVGSTLDYLVTGPHAGPSKIAKAEELGVSVIDEDLFRALI